MAAGDALQPALSKRNRSIAIASVLLGVCVTGAFIGTFIYHRVGWGSFPSSTEVVPAGGFTLHFAVPSNARARVDVTSTVPVTVGFVSSAFRDVLLVKATTPEAVLSNAGPGNMSAKCVFRNVIHQVVDCALPLAGVTGERWELIVVDERDLSAQSLLASAAKTYFTHQPAALDARNDVTVQLSACMKFCGGR